MNVNELANEIYKRYGSVTRARNCFLYTKKGVRLTDMFLENGRAILGWDAGNSFTYFKNYLSRALVGSFICEDNNRAQKAVSSLLSSDRKIYYFSNKKDALEAGLTISPTNTSVYKPWNWNNTKWDEISCVVIEPPLPWTTTLYILAVSSNQDLPPLLPASINVPFALQAALTRSIYNLIEALQTREEKNWFIYDPVLTKYWERKGPYLLPKVPQEKYNDFILHCLDLGIVINPDWNSPSIIPFGADKGVFTKLKNSPFILN